MQQRFHVWHHSPISASNPRSNSATSSSGRWWKLEGSPRPANMSLFPPAGSLLFFAALIFFHLLHQLLDTFSQHSRSAVCQLKGSLCSCLGGHRSSCQPFLQQQLAICCVQGRLCSHQLSLKHSNLKKWNTKITTTFLNKPTSQGELCAL